MSELTQCNYCSFKQFKRDAKREGKKLLRRSCPVGVMSGYDILIVPRDVKILKQSDSGYKAFRDMYCVSWMWVIGKRCEC